MIERVEMGLGTVEVLKKSSGGVYFLKSCN
jgi:hypothetical protein